MDNNIKTIRCKAVFDTNIEKINPLFSKVKIKIAYTGTNRNNSYISKESFEKALPTIYNCPIIGEFIESIDDFGSHGGKIEISDKGIKYIQTTKPYGVINENSEITWEDIVEKDGTVNTYLCATGYLWTGRYEELESVVKNSKSQSMEIEVVSGSSKDIDGQSVYCIEDFVFSAFCILGDDIEPCFQSSEITSYNFNKDEFKEQFNLMLKELRDSIEQTTKNQSSTLEVDNINFSKKEDNLVDEKLLEELLAKYNLTKESISFDINNLSLEEIESKIKEQFNKENKPVIEFSATYRQKREALSNALDPKIEKDDDGNITYEEWLWVEDFDDEYVYVEKSIWTSDNYERKYGRFTYTFNEETLTATITSEFEEMVLVWLTLEENQKLQEERENITKEFEKLKNEFNEYKSNYSTSNEEVEKLKNFKQETLSTQRKEQEDTLFSQFDVQLQDNEEYQNLKKNASNFSIEQLEKEVAFIVVKSGSNVKFSNKQNKKQTVKLEFSGNREEEKESPYGDLFSRYLKKE